MCLQALGAHKDKIGKGAAGIDAEIKKRVGGIHGLPTEEKVGIVPNPGGYSQWAP
ncbi:hypothetical protein GCM10027567_16660 [Spongiibacter taiwanensis]